MTTPLSPIQAIVHPRLAQSGVQLLVKRDDLLHPYMQGNKWRKLKYNLIEAQRFAHDTLLTYGGAHSNHIYATAAAGAERGLRTIGIIRGERTEPLNPTLAFAEASGMQLQFVSRTEYRNKETADFAAWCQARFGRYYTLPEGGSNLLALQGVAELADELPPCDYVAVACGTGATAAGLVVAQKSFKTLAFSVLKGGNFLDNSIAQFCDGYQKNDPVLEKNYALITDYAGRGYAKTTPQLLEFIADFERVTNIRIEPVYTGKLFFGLFDFIEKGYFARGSTVIAIHTGGLR